MPQYGRTKTQRQPGGRLKRFRWLIAALLVLVAAGVALWVWRFRTYTPMEVVQDIRAGLRARHTANPVEHFLEHRYGPLTEPANREKAFLDFFNVGHIEGLYLITSHMKDGERETNVAGMAQWVADYRRAMTPEEKEDLRTRFASEAGQKMVHQAVAKYLNQDVYARAATATVITELMTTLAEIQKQ